jgi:CHAD domain-containing protein
MAKARRIPGVSAVDPYTAAAARIVEIRVSELIEASAGVLDTEDIERLHDMRVATRRLRAALEIFEPCFPRAEWREGLGQVKALADALGERRDRDVAIASLGKVASEMSSLDRPGIETLTDRLRAEQGEANDALARLVKPDHLGPVFDQLQALARSAHGYRPPVSLNGPVPVPDGDIP